MKEKKIKAYDIYEVNKKIGEIYSKDRNKAFWKCISNYCEAFGWEYKDQAFRDIRLIRNPQADILNQFFAENIPYIEEYIINTTKQKEKMYPYDCNCCI